MRIRLVIMLLFLYLAVSAQQTLADLGYQITERNQKTFGVSDGSGREIVPPRYEAIDFETVPGFIMAGVYKPELSSVLGNMAQNLSYYSGGKPGIQYGNTLVMSESYRLNLRYGLFDRTGQKIIDFSFDEMEPLGTFIKVRDKGGNWGLYDLRGKEVISTSYTAIFMLRQFIVAFERSKTKLRYRVFDAQGKRYLPDDYEYVEVPTPKLMILSKDGTTALTRIDGGGDVLKGQFNAIQYLDSGYLAVQKADKWGIMDTLGREHTPFHFDHLLIRPGKRWFGNRDGQWGRINSKGEFVSALQFCRCNSAPQKIIPVFYKGKLGYINEQDKWVIEKEFTYAGEFRDGLATASVKGKEGIINEQGEWIIEPKNYQVSFSDGIIAVQRNSFPLAKELYDYHGKPIAKASFAYNLNLFTNGYAAYSDKTAKWGFIDKTGKIAIKSAFLYGGTFDDQLRAIVFEGDSKEASQQLSLITPTGSYLVQKVKDVKRVGSNYLITDAAGKIFIIDKEGTKIRDILFESAEPLGQYLRVNKGDKVGLTASDGLTLLDAQYEDVKLAEPSKNWVWVKDQLFGLFDLSAKQLIAPAAFEDVHPFDNQGFAFVKTGKWGAIDSNFKQVMEFKFDDVLNEPWLFKTKAVSFNGYWGLIDTAGKTALPFMYDEIVINALNRNYYSVLASGTRSCLGENLIEYVTVYE